MLVKSFLEYLFDGRKIVPPLPKIIFPFGIPFFHGKFNRCKKKKHSIPGSISAWSKIDN
jgi:hypothetical protein